jgi:hypothetical protein
MGVESNSSFVDMRLSKMKVAIKNIMFLATDNNLAMKQLMECEAIRDVTAKTTSTKHPKWTTMMAKNVRQVVNQTMETLADAPKQEERKLNLPLMSFEAKEGEIEKKLVQWLNTELLQGQMRLRAEVVTATQQRSTVTRASSSTTGARSGVVLLKFAINENRMVAL